MITIELGGNFGTLKVPVDSQFHFHGFFKDGHWTIRFYET
jgi:hypothetical protein